MSFYQIVRADSDDRAVITALLPSIQKLSEENQILVCDAYNTVWKNSSFKTLEEIRFSKHSQHYSLIDHVNEVVAIGTMLKDKAKELWSDSFTEKIDDEQMLMLLLLHDLDKVMLLCEENEANHLCERISHGILSALILNELGLNDRLVGLIANHSPSAALHTADPMAQVLHYADLFSADHIFMLVDRKPFFCH